METLTKSQKKILRKLISTDNYIEKCTSGLAIWNRNIAESQGRDFLNKIKNKDYKYLLNKGYLIESEEILLTDKGIIAGIKIKIAKLQNRLNNLKGL